VTSVNTPTSHHSELPRHGHFSGSTSQPASPLVLSQPAVVSSAVPVLRMPPQTTYTFSQSVKPPASSAVTVAGLLTSQPSWTALTTAATHLRPYMSSVAGLQTAFTRTRLPSTTVPSLHQLLSHSTSAASHTTKGRLPFSSSTPNLLAVGSKHVLVDSSTGHVITTVMSPAGNGRQLDDMRLGKNSSFASGITPGMASVSAVTVLL